MAESESPTPVSETDQQPALSEQSEAPDVDSMLGALPGFDQYFGAEQKSEKADSPEPSPGGEEVAEEAAPEAPHKPEGPVEAPEEEKDEKESPVQKRIDKLTSQKHEALERAEKAEARVKELEAQGKALPIHPTPENPLLHIQSVPELEQKLIDARRVKTWAIENLDGGPVQQGEEVRELSGAEVKKLLATAESLITEHIPKQLQYIQGRAQADIEVKKHYPNFLKTDTEEYQVLQQWVEMIPQVLQFSDFRLIIADALAGQRIRFAKNNAKNGAPAKTPATPLAAPQPSSAPRTPQKSVLSKDLLARIATDRRALDIFSESLIGTGGAPRK